MKRPCFSRPRTARKLLYIPPTQPSSLWSELDLATNRKASSSSSSVRTGTSLHGLHKTCLECRGNSPSTSSTFGQVRNRSSNTFDVFLKIREEKSAKRSPRFKLQ